MPDQDMTQGEPIAGHHLILTTYHLF
jgi:hypothetical protein